MFGTWWGLEWQQAGNPLNLQPCISETPKANSSSSPELVCFSMIGSESVWPWFTFLYARRMSSVSDYQELLQPDQERREGGWPCFPWSYLLGVSCSLAVIRCWLFFCESVVFFDDEVVNRRIVSVYVVAGCGDQTKTKPKRNLGRTKLDKTNKGSLKVGLWVYSANRRYSNLEKTGKTLQEAVNFTSLLSRVKWRFELSGVCSLYAPQKNCGAYLEQWRINLGYDRLHSPL